MNHGTVDTHDIPLCVDLDGTLIRSDMLLESLLILLKERPWMIFLLPGWVMGGKEHFKTNIAERVEMSVEDLPFNMEFISFLTAKKEAGRTLVLVTASHEKFARMVSEHLGIFSEVFSTGNGVNLSGTKKRDLLVSRFGEKGFDYAGNASPDLEVWKAGREAIVVEAPRNVRNKAEREAHVVRTFSSPPLTFRLFLRALRVHQWIKNILIFVLLFAAHRETDPVLLGKDLLAFVAFSLCASSVYILNDLLDLSSDRKHPRKRHRPFAAGHLPISAGLLASPILLLLAFASGFVLKSEFVMVLGTYFLLTLGYSLWAKRIMILDIILLAVLYTLRIIAGGAAASIPTSFWLLSFSVFFFLALAMVKRYSELLVMKRLGQISAHGRGYHTEDFPVILSLGTASGYAAVLVLALYINSPEVRALYHHPEFLWILIPVLLFWMSRIWLITHRGGMHDDPVIFAIKDKISLLLLPLIVLILLGAT